MLVGVVGTLAVNPFRESLWQKVIPVTAFPGGFNEQLVGIGSHCGTKRYRLRILARTIERDRVKGPLPPSDKRLGWISIRQPRQWYACSVSGAG